MPDAGNIVTVPFPGVTGVKQRPAVILSSAVYHANRPDVILGLLTTQVSGATGPTDFILQDWAVAGLRQPTAFRAFLVTVPRSEIIAHIGRLSDSDWREVRACVGVALVDLPDTAP